MRFTVAFAALTLAAQAPPTPALYHPTASEFELIDQKTTALDAALKPLRGHVADDLLVDAEVYLKAAQFARRFDEFYAKASVNQVVAVLDTGIERARQLAAKSPSWPTRKGSFSRAYRSRVDGSIQPYAVTIPDNYNGSTPEWLEVVLHGRGATLNEVSFLASHDKMKPAPADHEFIQLDVFGRANNAYRWAGETDVFEAIESVRKRYRIDPERIVLRGFSMGGAGAWHIGLHDPGQWAAVEAGAGFVETKVHASIENPPPYAHIYDALDYALNAVNVPIVGYGGEDDPQLRASVFIRKELEREGFKFQPDGLNFKTDDLQALFLIGPKTQHKWHPESKKVSDAFILAHQSQGRLIHPKLRFVTYTERYNQYSWVTVDQLEKQYHRAQVDAELDSDNLKVTTSNVARLTLRGEPPLNRFTIDGQVFPMAQSAGFERTGGKWRKAAGNIVGKSHGLQGPIDDAFMDSFVCVKPAASAASSAVNDYAQRELDRFAKEFPQWMRGDIRIKADREIPPSDIRDQNIVLFGTPATSPMIEKTLRSTPVRWTQESIVIGDRKFDAGTHMLSMIYPNPSNRRRYVVINGSHTFHDADFKGTNALLYPKVGDWAVTDVRTGTVVAEGVFDRNWQLSR